MATLILSSDFPPLEGGIARISFELANSLQRNGEEVVVLTTVAAKNIPSSHEQELRVIRAGWANIRLLSYLSLFVALCRILLTRKIERIHALLWFPDGAASLIASRIFRVPYLVSTYAAEVLPKKASLKRLVFKKLMLLVLAKAKAITAISQFTKVKLAGYGIDSQRITVIPGGTDPVRFSPDVDPAQVVREFNLSEKKVILTVGRLDVRKGHDMVIRALSQVLREVPNAVYLIVGKGQEFSRLKELVAKLKLDEHVIFAGYVEDDKLAEYYNACDVFIMPSREIKETGDAEGFGIVYLEANACGKPVVGGRSGGIGDAIIHGYNGLLVDPLSVEEVAYSLIELLRNELLARKMGMNGRKRVVDELNWDVIAHKLQQLYSSRSKV
jgi:phosphatidylinositol alpha-1,6-mannosyltransferase